jgi:methionine-rich copper-binding protein CopC
MKVIDSIRRRVFGTARGAALAGAAVLLLGTAARTGSADTFHLRLLRTAPAADSTVATPPAEIRLWFSVAPEMATTSVRVTGPNGRAVPLAPLRHDRGRDAPVVAPLRAPAAPGRYSVAWRTMSSDGHVVRGTFAFTVAAPAHNH